ncbi:hypothetical protein DIS24_g11023 [Lasiodiplodia hormozganensis]|uniref:Uncharacterized protein n=1 Tax=Lasiodiplodia hormozganensis TaxID=869390 RepID=A0AA39X1P0_9PEZI|nr:hypothetical protein DIS24_g11023 [Lasiodiplodia hormozganensis]
MILRGLAGGLLVPLVAAAALRPRQDEDTRPYRILQIDVQARVLLQPIVVDTFVRRATELAVFPGLTIPVTDAPTLVDTTVTGTTITHVTSYRTIVTKRPEGTQSPPPTGSSTLPNATFILPSATFPPSISILPTRLPFPSSSIFSASDDSSDFTFSFSEDELTIIIFNVVLYNFEVIIYDILQGFAQRAIILKFHVIIYKVFDILDCYVIVDCCPDSTCGESFGSAE